MVLLTSFRACIVYAYPDNHLNLEEAFHIYWGSRITHNCRFHLALHSFVINVD